MVNDLREKFISIIKKDDELIELLRIVRDLDLPDCYIGAGAVRNLVWDSLHGYEKRTSLNDIDVVYCDSNDVRAERDIEIWRKLCENRGDVEWNVFNQARPYIRDKPRTTSNSTVEGIATWPETPTCIGVRLNGDDSFDICAPYGIEDLMGLVVRPSGNSIGNLELYKGRVLKKRWKEIWPRLEILY